VFGLAYAAYTLSNPAIGAHAAKLSPLKVWGAGVGCFGGVVEEIVFRGFVLTELDRIRTSVRLQVLVSGVVFGLLHAGFSPAGMMLTFVIGLVLA
jgi:membrane protease YdiL (CAAX protease family)